MASFWKNNICVPTWTDLVKDWFNGQPSKLIDSTPQIRPFTQGVYIRKATSDDLQQLPEFWSRWYSTTKSARCMVPMSHVLKMAKGEIFVCVNQAGEVIGSIVRRWLTGLHMREVRWPRAGVIDYFCIHPAHRKKGIGRALLTFLHNSTLYTEKIMLPQMMLWEGVQPTIPPASVGMFLHRKCYKGTITAVEEDNCAEIWAQMQRGKDIWNESCESPGETSIWTVGQHRLAIWNTFHRSVPEGLLIGIVVGGDQDTANAFSQASGHPFGILLMSGLSSSGWTLDSPYQWISYNTKMNFISYQFPGIFL